MPSKKRTKTFADELLELSNPTPIDIDPDGGFEGESHVLLNDDDYGPISQTSRLRKALPVNLKPSLQGKVTSRANIQAGDDDDSDGFGEDGRIDSSASEDNEVNESKEGSQGDTDDNNDANSGDDIIVSQGQDEDGSEEGSDDSDELPNNRGNNTPSGGSGSDDDGHGDIRLLNNTVFNEGLAELAQDKISFFSPSSTSPSMLDFQGEQARCVKAQHNLWQSLLKTRIRLQQPLLASHRLPRPTAFRALNAHDARLPSAYASMQTRLGELLSSLLTLQSRLLAHHELPHLAEELLSAQAVASVSKDQSLSLADAFWPHVAQSVGGSANEPAWSWITDACDMWHARTQAAAGQTGAGTMGLKAINLRLSQQIERELADPDRLLARTRIKRSASSDLGRMSAKKAKGGCENDTEEMDGEVFDDTDFYQQTLRDIIAAGVEADDTNGLSLSAAMARKSSRKSQVERRASKGRKIRFAVMPKLLNFMAPRALEAFPIADELFSNLFGHKTAFTSSQKNSILSKQLSTSTSLRNDVLNDTVGSSPVAPAIGAAIHAIASRALPAASATALERDKSTKGVERPRATTTTSTSAPAEAELNPIPLSKSTGFRLI